jgi:gamma-glutamyl phosphate reductase
VRTSFPTPLSLASLRVYPGDTAARVVLPGTFIWAIGMRADVVVVFVLDQHIDLVIPHVSNALVGEIQHGIHIPYISHTDEL